MHSMDKDIYKKMRETLIKLNEVEKETLWKIKDCSELLKTRPTESYVNGVVDILEKKSEQTSDDFTKRFLEIETRITEGGTIKEDGQSVGTGWDNINVKLLEMENK